MRIIAISKLTRIMYPARKSPKQKNRPGHLAQALCGSNESVYVHNANGASARICTVDHFVRLGLVVNQIKCMRWPKQELQQTHARAQWRQKQKRGNIVRSDWGSSNSSLHVMRIMRPPKAHIHGHFILSGIIQLIKPNACGDRSRNPADTRQDLTATTKTRLAILCVHYVIRIMRCLYIMRIRYPPKTDSHRSFLLGRQNTIN